MEKEISESIILFQIYDKSKFKKITKREKPDFEIEHNHGYKFGVEVTEFYFSETNARRRNIPDYVGDILSHRKYKHKDDIEKLKVKKVTVISDGKPNGNMDVILQKLPEKNELISLISEVIKNKNKKYDNYDKKLGHINLIISDMENRYYNIDKKDFYRYFFNNDLVSSIKNSPFREIFFITELNNKTINGSTNHKQYFIPLRLTFLMFEISLINLFIQKNKKLLSSLSEYQYENIIYLFLKYTDINDISLIEKRNSLEVLYSNYGIFFDKQNQLSYLDYLDNQLPQSNQVEIEQIDESTINQYLMFKENDRFGFELEISFEVRN